ncbi:PTS sugar transporter subunit IIC [Bombilactobacillus bombi]|uniref:PTS mannose transporter subunit IICD n=1 Tax=Bombilactobacillus bombi TaxID=1303590 RepID=A0A347ST79_9LACO|nr:PTS sugar transporter subunit IIC [Bombilactobacillus bombi]AXX65238.1 PTS sugar transporter subunit IIC [Bombilactobacillus bombi]MCO6542085.1 PTS sugar transporter subunit IIC [Lactobacillus sp.]RHW46306.1 PTS mannose transporter subunit IICD [Bombilactobacillus bombi]
MLFKAIMLGLVSVVGVIDSRLIGRQNIGRPLILSTLAGLVLGNVQQGIILGASLELISMGFVAIGAAAPPNMQIGSVIATAFAILSHASTQTALAIALPIAVAAQFLDILMRMIMAQFGHMADKAIANNHFKKAQHIHVYWAFALNAILYFALIFITIYFGADSVKNIVDMIPKVITHGLTVAGNLLSALGFAMLLSTMLNKKLFLYFLFGFLIVAYLKVDLIGVTLFSIILAFIMDKVNYGKEVSDDHS